MYKNKTISLCLPCRNEAADLPAFIASIPKCIDEIILISNRSTDDSVAVAKRLGIKVIEDNRAIDGIGYGFAHISGIDAAESDLIVGADCDGTYPLELLPQIIDYMIEEEKDFISCNRYPLMDGSKIPLKLRVGVGALNAECRLLYGIKMQDILSGMWVFKREVRDQLQLTAGDWNLSPQIKLNAATNSLINFAEYNIPQHPRNGRTHQAYFKTGFAHARWIATNRFADYKMVPLTDETQV